MDCYYDYRPIAPTEKEIFQSMDCYRPIAPTEQGKYCIFYNAIITPSGLQVGRNIISKVFRAVGTTDRK